MMLKATIAAALAAGLIAPAGAQTFSTSTTGYSGTSGATITFDSALPNGFSLNGGRVVSSSTAGINAQPLGSTGNYLTTDIGAAKISSAIGYDSVNFLWGSIDSYNFVKFFDQAGALIGQLTGSDVAVGPANGNQTSTDTNRYVTYSVDPASNRRISSLELNSNGYALEADNVSFYNANSSSSGGASSGGTPGGSSGGTGSSGGGSTGGGTGPVPVPEPGTMLLFALGAAGLMFVGQRRTSLIG